MADEEELKQADTTLGTCALPDCPRDDCNHEVRGEASLF